MGIVRSPRETMPVTLSRRILLRGAAAGVVLPSAGWLAGCTALSSANTPLDATAISVRPTLLVATTRRAVNGGGAPPWFGGERAAGLNLARAKLVPPDQGRFSLTAIGLGDWSIAAIEPVKGLTDLIPPEAEQRDLLIYVHGFNQTFETAVLDAARLSDDIRFRGETMVFAWPSKAKLFDYAYDRDSAMWSRDALERMLSLAIASPGVGRIHIVAHSVGTMLSLEALRQVYARHGLGVADKFGAVIFAAPDIDMDVFSSSLERMRPLVANITVVTATTDRALAVAGWIAGGMTRVGAAEKAQLEKLGVRVIDATAEGWGLINHDLFLSNRDIRQVIRQAIDAVVPHPS